MTFARLTAFLRLALRARTRAATGLVLAGAALSVLAACQPGDVGAPCNHGRIEPPQDKLVTFPALTCDDLLCVYAEEPQVPEGGCTTNAECNVMDPTVQRFECDPDTSTCRLSLQHVLARSMCSKRCETESDCEDGGIGEQVLAESTACQSGFTCASIQTLGELCCERLCVCRDDLNQATASQISADCEAGTQVGCCLEDDGATKKCVDEYPDACGGAPGGPCAPAPTTTTTGG
jgi:hypothetical protein